MQSRKPTVPEPRSFYWYDLETSGTHAASDRIMQFAGRRTDAALNPIGEPYTTFVRLAPGRSAASGGVRRDRDHPAARERGGCRRVGGALVRSTGACVNPARA